MKTKNIKNTPQNFVVKSRFVRMAPDKIRLVSKVLLNKDINQALNILQFVPKAAAKPLILVIKNAQNILKDRDYQRFLIKTIIIDEGPKLKRRRMIQRGRSTTILKRMSHITVVLSEQPKVKVKGKRVKR